MMPRCTRSPPECSSSLFCGRPSSCRPLLLLLLPLFLTRCFLLRDGCAARTFAGARIGMRALAAHRKPTTMAQAEIRANVNQTLDVHLNSLAKVAFDFALRLENCANAAQLFLAEIAHACIETHLRFVQNRRRARSANSVNVS